MRSSSPDARTSGVTDHLVVVLKITLVVFVASSHWTWTYGAIGGIPPEHCGTLDGNGAAAWRLSRQV
jgi:hypothetical protein